MKRYTAIVLALSTLAWYVGVCMTANPSYGSVSYPGGDEVTGGADEKGAEGGEKKEEEKGGEGEGGSTVVKKPNGMCFCKKCNKEFKPDKEGNCKCPECGAECKGPECKECGDKKNEEGKDAEKKS